MPRFRRKQASPQKQAPISPIAVAEGANGAVELYEQTLRIKRNDQVKDIMLVMISSVQLKRPGFCNPGFFEVSFSGGQESQWIHAENTVVFKKKHLADFERFKAELDQRLVSARKSSGA